MNTYFGNIAFSTNDKDSVLSTIRALKNELNNIFFSENETCSYDPQNDYSDYVGDKPFYVFEFASNGEDFESEVMRCGVAVYQTAVAAGALRASVRMFDGDDCRADIEESGVEFVRWTNEFPSDAY